MSRTKILIIVLCLVLCTAVAAFYFYNSNNGGYGPKVKGLRLGQKMTAKDIFMWRKKESGTPSFGLTFADQYFQRGDHGTPNYIEVGFNTDKDTAYSNSCAGWYLELSRKEWKINEMLSEIDKIGIRQFRVGYADIVVSLSKDGIITKMDFYKSAFSDNSLDVTNEDFAGMFMNAYKIPNLEQIDKNKWQYKNFSEGWQVTIDRGTAVVEALSLSSSSFN